MTRKWFNPKRPPTAEPVTPQPVDVSVTMQNGASHTYKVGSVYHNPTSGALLLFSEPGRKGALVAMYNARSWAYARGANLESDI